jgi:hypothetical protein
LKRPIHFLALSVILLVLLAGCQSFGDSSLPDTYVPQVAEEKLNEASNEASNELPLPQLELSLFIPFLPPSNKTRVSIAPPLPIYREPIVVKEEPSPPEVVAPVPKEPVVKEESPSSSVVKETVPQKEEKVEQEDLNSDPEPTVIGEEYFLPDEVSLVILEGSDWFYLKEKDGESLDFVDRTVMDGKTIFSFEFPEKGRFTLVFQRQDLSSGDTEEGELKVIVQDMLPESTSLDEEEAPDSGQDLVEEDSGDNEEKVQEKTNIPSVAAAEERLDEIEEDPDRVEETIDLLEFLMDAASDDESLAEYYYRMARILEMNTRFQDLRKSYEIYQYIVDTFFLTDYYDLSIERLRYLDRHFFKLR